MIEEEPYDCSYYAGIKCTIVQNRSTRYDLIQKNFYSFGLWHDVRFEKYDVEVGERMDESNKLF